jgi:hypothetical protein
MRDITDFNFTPSPFFGSFSSNYFSPDLPDTSRPEDFRIAHSAEVPLKVLLRIGTSHALVSEHYAKNTQKPNPPK